MTDSGAMRWLSLETIHRERLHIVITDDFRFSEKYPRKKRPLANFP
jgi:hypothetical protein